VKRQAALRGRRVDALLNRDGTSSSLQGHPSSGRDPSGSARSGRDPDHERRLTGLPGGLDRQHVLGHVSPSDVGQAEHEVADRSCYSTQADGAETRGKIAASPEKNPPQPPKSTPAPISIGATRQW
jgi:hypothetical protein